MAFRVLDLSALTRGGGNNDDINARSMVGTPPQRVLTAPNNNNHGGGVGSGPTPTVHHHHDEEWDEVAARSRARQIIPHQPLPSRVSYDARNGGSTAVVIDSSHAKVGVGRGGKSGSAPLPTGNNKGGERVAEEVLEEIVEEADNLLHRTPKQRKKDKRLVRRWVPKFMKMHHCIWTLIVIIALHKTEILTEANLLGYGGARANDAERCNCTCNYNVTHVFDEDKNLVADSSNGRHGAKDAAGHGDGGGKGVLKNRSIDSRDAHWPDDSVGSTGHNEKTVVGTNTKESDKNTTAGVVRNDGARERAISFNNAGGGKPPPFADFPSQTESNVVGRDSRGFKITNRQY